jgi:hypothetical protein
MVDRSMNVTILIGSPGEESNSNLRATYERVNLLARDIFPASERFIPISGFSSPHHNHSPPWSTTTGKT